MFSAGTSWKFEPVIVTILPADPFEGEKLVIAGEGNQVNPANDELPPEVVTLTIPDDSEPTVAVIEVEELIVNESTGISPMLTAVAPVKDVPVIFIMVPWVPFIGVKELIVGSEI